jgi:hypothetical protein
MHLSSLYGRSYSGARVGRDHALSPRGEFFSDSGMLSRFVSQFTSGQVFTTNCQAIPQRRKHPRLAADLTSGSRTHHRSRGSNRVTDDSSHQTGVQVNSTFDDERRCQAVWFLGPIFRRCQAVWFLGPIFKIRLSDFCPAQWKDCSSKKTRFRPGARCGRTPRGTVFDSTRNRAGVRREGGCEPVS